MMLFMMRNTLPLFNSTANKVVNGLVNMKAYILVDDITSGQPIWKILPVANQDL